MSDIQALGLTVARAADLLAELENHGPRTGADSGAPHTSSREIYSADSVRCGVWECTPGGWDIENRLGTETMVILNGRVRITTKGQAPVEIAAGDAFILPAGWSGRWETIETVRKIYTIA